MISQNRYVKVTSGVGAGNSVKERKLIMRGITRNTLVPPGVVLEFASPDAVLNYFGAASEEYKRAAAYMGFVSKSSVSPELISFCRWVSTDIAPMVVGDSLPKTVGQFAATQSGILSISVGNAVTTITGIDLTAAADLTAVASIVQASIRAAAASASVPQLASATVTYNTNTNQFVLTGSVTGSGTITVVATAVAGDISVLMGLATSGAVIVAGQAADSPVDAISKSAAISNNMGSFVFVGAALQNSEIQEVAAWNHAQNEMYIYAVPTTLSNLGTLFALVKGYSGCSLNVISSTLANDYVEQSPCEIFAATDYNAVNGVQNYMFYSFANRNVTVSDDTTANTADASRGNYIGLTQSAGQGLAFYQRGILCGGPSDAVDTNVYANEIWLKSSITSRILELFLNVQNVPANPTGASMILAVLQAIFTQALTNGTFSAGKTLTTVQRQYIAQVTGDNLAYNTVQTNGYWFNLTYGPYVNDNTNLTEYRAVYKLIYSKGDSIRLVEGVDTLI